MTLFAGARPPFHIGKPLDFKLEQRGSFPPPAWSPTDRPRLRFYACAMRVNGKRRTPWFVRVSLTWGAREFWFYLWPLVGQMGGNPLRRVGSRRLLTPAEELARNLVEGARRCPTPAS